MKTQFNTSIQKTRKHASIKQPFCFLSVFFVTLIAVSRLEALLLMWHQMRLTIVYPEITKSNVGQKHYIVTHLSVLKLNVVFWILTCYQDTVWIITILIRILNRRQRNEDSFCFDLNIETCSTVDKCKYIFRGNPIIDVMFWMVCLAFDCNDKTEWSREIILFIHSPIYITSQAYKLCQLIK